MKINPSTTDQGAMDYAKHMALDQASSLLPSFTQDLPRNSSIFNRKSRNGLDTGVNSVSPPPTYVRGGEGANKQTSHAHKKFCEASFGIICMVEHIISLEMNP